MDGEGRNGLIQGQQSQELLQLQQQPQRCPRCDSLNTKFCYFNNYSQSQPRYFCKACRRYWTQGGTLRNVPIGGSCRKGKRARLESSSGEAVRSLAAAPIAPAPNQPSPAPLQPAQFQATLTSASPNVVPSNPVLGIRESGPTVPAFGVAPTMHMASYYPGEDGYLSSLLSNTKSLSVGSNAAGTSNFIAMPGFYVQPLSYEQQQQQRQIRQEQFYQMDNRERSIDAMYPRQHGLAQSGMPAGGSAYQLYLSQNFMNDANHSGSVSNASAGSSLDPNQSPRMPEYDPSP